MTEPLLEFRNLTVTYDTPAGELTAVSNASFTIERGEYFGLVGESGCGKTTLAKSIIGGLDENGSIKSGKILLEGEEIQDLSERERNEQVRWKKISWIPQSAMNSLDPIEKISDQAIEIAKAHTEMSKKEALEKFKSAFTAVGLPEDRVTDYPHQFSGGMEQRAIVALSLFLEPSLIIADEPTTALDVIMQDQIFQLLDEMQDEFNTSMLLITHDISVVFENCKKMTIMHGGQVAETGSTEEIYDNPRHPYSILLQQAFPDVRYPKRNLEVIEGVPPQLVGKVDYCSFKDRCPWAVEECEKQEPPLEKPSGDSESLVACFRRDDRLELNQSESKKEANNE